MCGAFPWRATTLMVPTCKSKLNAFKNGSRSEPDGFAAIKEWEADWVDKAFRAVWPAPPKQGVFLGRSLGEQLWGSAVQPVRDIPPTQAAWPFAHVAEAEVEALNERRSIKRELEVSFFEKSAALASKMRGNYINVDSKAGSGKSQPVQVGGSSSSNGYLADAIGDLQSLEWLERIFG